MSKYHHKPNAGQESHLDPPDEPTLKNDDELLSTCCGANSLTEIFDGLGICSFCGEHEKLLPDIGSEKSAGNPAREIDRGSLLKGGNNEQR